MTQPLQKLTMPQGLITRRSMPWGVRVLLAGLTLGIVGVTGFLVHAGMDLSRAVDQEFPAQRRHDVAERMKNVSKLLKDTVLYTECPVLPSPFDDVRKKGRVLKAQFGQHHGLIVPYVSYRALASRGESLSGFFKSFLTDLVVEHRFSSDEQMDLFLDGVAFFVGEESDVHGVRDASYALLGKSPEKLSPAEVALLASSINYPRPFRFADDVALTQEGILQKMNDEGLISPAELEVALREISRDDDERQPASND